MDKIKMFARMGLFGAVLLTAIVYTMSQSATTSAALIPSTNGATNDKQRILQEVAKAFYLKGDNIQYESDRNNRFASPEDITNQSDSYMVCSGFTYSVYYSAFRLMIPQITARLNVYGKDYYGVAGHDDIVMFKNGDDLQSLSTTAGKNAFKQELLSALQVGDVISYYSTINGNGHATLVYDFEYDSSNNKTNAIILHSTPSFKRTTNKLTSGLSWNNRPANSITGVDEGTIHHTKLDEIVNAVADKKDYFTIYRPLAVESNNNRAYNKVACEGNGSLSSVSCTSSLDTYENRTDSLARIKYPGIQIEKTVDVFNESVVEPGDVLTYDIAITNNSNADYQNVVINENIPTDFVDSASKGGQLNWTIGTIRAGSTHHQKYSVKVREDNSLIGKKIASTGTVAGIQSATVMNTIGDNLSSEEQSKIIASYNKLKGTHSGAELVDAIYKDALNYELDIKNLKLGAHHNTSSVSVETNNKHKNCNPYYEAEDSGALLKSRPGYYAGGSQILNTEHKFANNIINNYYSALVPVYQDATSCDISTIVMKFWNTYDDDVISQRSKRATRVFPETLQTGDVLIYTNTGTTKQPVDPVTKENGTYAYIWISDNQGGGNFYGVNSLIDGTSQNTIYGVNNETANSLQTLFAKDFYAILRPSLTMNVAPDEPSDPTPEPEPADDKSGEIDDHGDGYTDSPVTPDTGRNTAKNENGYLNMSLLVGIIATIIFSLSRMLRYRNKVDFDPK